MQKADSFLITCKQNYFEKVRPADIQSKARPGYIKLVEIAKEYFSNNEYEYFAGFFQEGQYFIELWAAHMLLEYGRPNQKLASFSLAIIKKYSHSQISPDVAEQETSWLQENNAKYNVE
ncbi:MAG TPA: hypothetical protein VG101_13075 [Puia sp.]|jgi:hypothetical protein|nr:hypothetical protein [Puia sp.]